MAFGSWKECLSDLDAASLATSSRTNGSRTKFGRATFGNARACGHQLISGVGRQPFGEHYELDFAEKMEGVKPEIQINDC